jgi:hypothetical protein
LDDCSAQVFPYNIFAYCSICRVDCKFARNKKKISRVVLSSIVGWLVWFGWLVSVALDKPGGGGGADAADALRWCPFMWSHQCKTVIGGAQEAGGRHSTLAASGQPGQEAVQPSEQVSGREAPRDLHPLPLPQFRAKLFCGLQRGFAIIQRLANKCQFFY